MSSIISTRGLQKALSARGLVPDNCRLIEVSMSPTGPLVIRYEVFVASDRFGLFADAMKAAADEAIADDDRNKLGRSERVIQ